MAKKKSKCECPAGEKWAVPYADFLSLLLALFIALFALASVNTAKQKSITREFIKIYSFVKTDTSEEQSETENAAADLLTTAALKGDPLDRSTSLLVKEPGTLMNIPASLTFPVGQDELKSQEYKDFIKKLAQLIVALPQDTQINIKGYAEDSEVPRSKYKDALDLSSARANNIIRDLQKYNISNNRLYSSAYGSSKSDVLKDKRSVVFEAKSLNDIDKKDVDLDTIFNNLNR